MRSEEERGCGRQKERANTEIVGYIVLKGVEDRRRGGDRRKKESGKKGPERIRKEERGVEGRKMTLLLLIPCQVRKCEKVLPRRSISRTN